MEADKQERVKGRVHAISLTKQQSLKKERKKGRIKRKDRNLILKTKKNHYVQPFTIQTDYTLL